jgi:hypothetical protein
LENFYKIIGKYDSSEELLSNYWRLISQGDSKLKKDYRLRQLKAFASERRILGKTEETKEIKIIAGKKTKRFWKIV